MKNLNLKVSILLLTLFAVSCNETKKDENAASTDISSLRNEYFINAILYNYYAAEYKALSYQAFNAASDYIKLLKISFPHRADMAIVLDLDETLLDNSPYQARLYEINASYDSLWNDWCNFAVARPIPGALEFLNLADSMGFNLFYISNRKLKNVYTGTLKNMKELGFPQADSLHLFLREKENSKESRRIRVEKEHEIVMLVGDNAGDFYEDTMDYLSRDSIVSSRQHEFGHRLIVLPNAIYGNWIESLGIQNKRDLDSLIANMTLPFKNQISSNY